MKKADGKDDKTGSDNIKVRVKLLLNGLVWPLICGVLFGRVLVLW